MTIKATELMEILQERVRRQGDFSVACIAVALIPPQELMLVNGETDEILYEFDCKALEVVDRPNREPSPPATAGGTDSPA